MPQVPKDQGVWSAPSTSGKHGAHLCRPGLPCRGERAGAGRPGPRPHSAGAGPRAPIGSGRRGCLARAAAALASRRSRDWETEGAVAAAGRGEERAAKTKMAAAPGSVAAEAAGRRAGRTH